MQIIHNFTNFTKPFIGGRLWADSIGFFTGSKNDFLSHGILLEVNWGWGGLLFGIDNELGSDGFGAFGRSDTGVLAESVPGLLH